MNDELKSVEKIAEATRDIIVKTSDFFDKYFGDPAVQMGGIAGDWMKYYRYKNMLSIFDKVKELHRKRKFEGKPIPVSPRIAIPLLDAASAEDEETLQNMWANLIVNSTDPSAKIDVHPGFIEILKQLTPDEAKFIDRIVHRKGYPSYPTITAASESQRYYGSSWPGLERFSSLYASFSNCCLEVGLIYEKNKHKTIYDNLIRLRIAELNDKQSYEIIYNKNAEHSDQEMEITISSEEKMTFSSLGQQIVKLCIGEQQQS